MKIVLHYKVEYDSYNYTVSEWKQITNAGSWIALFK